MLTLSPGERAGVRASVNANFTKNVEESKIENTRQVLYQFPLDKPFRQTQSQKAENGRAAKPAVH